MKNRWTEVSKLRSAINFTTVDMRFREENNDMLLGRWRGVGMEE